MATKKGRERGERKEKIKAKQENKTLFTKLKTYKISSPKTDAPIVASVYKTRGALYRQPQGMKIPKNLTTKLSYWIKE